MMTAASIDYIYYRPTASALSHSGEYQNAPGNIRFGQCPCEVSSTLPAPNPICMKMTAAWKSFVYKNIYSRPEIFRVPEALHFFQPSDFLAA